MLHKLLISVHCSPIKMEITGKSVQPNERVKITEKKKEERKKEILENKI